MKVNSSIKTITGGRIDHHQAFNVYCTPIDDGKRYPSYQDVARHFGVSDTTIERWGTKFDWVKRREMLGEKRIAQAQEKAVDVLAERLANDRENLIEEIIKKDLEDSLALEGGINVAIKIITNLQAELEKPVITIAERNEGIEGITDAERKNVLKELKMQTLELLNLSNAMKNVKNFKRVLLGLPTEVSKMDVTNRNLNVNLTPEDIAKANEFIAKNARYSSTD